MSSLKYLLFYYKHIFARKKISKGYRNLKMTRLWGRFTPIFYFNCKHNGLFVNIVKPKQTQNFAIIARNKRNCAQFSAIALYFLAFGFQFFENFQFESYGKQYWQLIIAQFCLTSQSLFSIYAQICWT